MAAEDSVFAMARYLNARANIEEVVHMLKTGDKHLMDKWTAYSPADEAVFRGYGIRTCDEPKDLLRLAATKCGIESLDFVMMKGWFEVKDVEEWLCSGHASVTPERLRAVLSYAAARSWMHRSLKLQLTLETWALERRCDLVEVLVRYKAAPKPAPQCMTRLARVDDWCPHCRNTLLGPEGWVVDNSYAAAEVTNQASRFPLDALYGPQLLRLVELAVEYYQHHEESAPLNLLICERPQVIEILRRHRGCYKKLLRDLMLRQAPLPTSCPGVFSMNHIVRLARLVGERENFGTLRKCVPTDKLNALLEAGGLELLAVDPRDVLINFLKCPRLTPLMSRADLLAPAESYRMLSLKKGAADTAPSEPCNLLVLLKKGKDDAALTSVWSAHPDAFYEAPGVLKHLACDKKLIPAARHIRGGVIHGVTEAMLLSQRSPDSPMGMLDVFCLRMIAELALKQ
jgi:hypothetical protein